MCGPYCTAYHGYTNRVNSAAATATAVAAAATAAAASAAKRATLEAALRVEPPSPCDTEATLSWGQSLLEFEMQVPTGVFGWEYSQSAQELWQMTHFNCPLTTFTPGKTVRGHRWTFESTDPNGKSTGTLNFDYLCQYARGAASAAAGAAADAAAAASAAAVGDACVETDGDLGADAEVNRPVWACPLLLREVEFDLRKSDFQTADFNQGATDGESNVRGVVGE